MLNKMKILEGLEFCTKADAEHQCENCQYHEQAYCDCELKDDALALLKEYEAKEGKWIEQIDYMGDIYYDCSICGESWMTIEGTPWQNGMDYCPHCGAKMNLESR